MVDSWSTDKAEIEWSEVWERACPLLSFRTWHTRGPDAHPTGREPSPTYRGRAARRELRHCRWAGWGGQGWLWRCHLLGHLPGRDRGWEAQGGCVQGLWPTRVARKQRQEGEPSWSIRCRFSCRVQLAVAASDTCRNRKDEASRGQFNTSVSCKHSIFYFSVNWNENRNWNVQSKYKLFTFKLWERMSKNLGRNL